MPKQKKAKEKTPTIFTPDIRWKWDKGEQTLLKGMIDTPPHGQRLVIEIRVKTDPRTGAKVFITHDYLNGAMERPATVDEKREFEFSLRPKETHFESAPHERSPSNRGVWRHPLDITPKSRKRNYRR